MTSRKAVYLIFDGRYLQVERFEPVLWKVHRIVDSNEGWQEGFVKGSGLRLIRNERWLEVRSIRSKRCRNNV